MKISCVKSTVILGNAWGLIRKLLETENVFIRSQNDNLCKILHVNIEGAYDRKSQIHYLA